MAEVRWHSQFDKCLKGDRRVSARRGGRAASAPIDRLRLSRQDVRLLTRCLMLRLQGRRSLAVQSRRKLRRRLIPQCSREHNADAAIALGDIALRTPTRYKYYRMAVSLEPDNVEALCHLALQAAELGRRREARRCSARAIKNGLGRYPSIADVLQEILVSTAKLLGDRQLEQKSLRL